MIPSITVFDPHPSRPLVKRFRINPHTGDLESARAPSLLEANGYHIAAPTPADLASILDATTHQSISLGHPFHYAINTSFPVVSRNHPSPPPGSIFRTKDFFQFSEGPGWMLIDFDQIPNTIKTTSNQSNPIAETYAALAYLWPEAAHASIVIRPSSSSGLYRCDQQPPSHFPKMHAFVLIADQRNAFPYLQTLAYRAASIGLPEMIDRNVASPERLIYIAPPNLCPYTYRKTIPTYFSDERPPITMHNPDLPANSAYYYSNDHTHYNKATIPTDLKDPATWPQPLRLEIDNYIHKLTEHLASDIFHAKNGHRANTLFQSGAKLGNLLWTGSPALGASGQILLQAAQDAGYDDDHYYGKAKGHLTNGWNHGVSRPFTDIPPLVRWPNRHEIVASGIAIMDIMRRSST